MIYRIEAREWSGPGVKDGEAPHGYEEDAYLPGFGAKAFASPAEAQAWLDAHHQGPDCDGVTLAFAVEEYPDLPTSILDTRVPQPGEYDAYGVPDEIAAQADALLKERNTCSDARVDEIDTQLLELLRPWTR